MRSHRAHPPCIVLDCGIKSHAYPNYTRAVALTVIVAVVVRLNAIKTTLRLLIRIVAAVIVAVLRPTGTDAVAVAAPGFVLAALSGEGGQRQRVAAGVVDAVVDGACDHRLGSLVCLGMVERLEEGVGG